MTPDEMESRLLDLEQAMELLRGRITGGLDRIESKLLEVRGVVVGEEAEEEDEANDKPAPSSAEWDEFVAASGLDARLEFTPEDLYEALDRAIADWVERHPDRDEPYAWSSCVAKQLKEWPSKSDVIRVAQGLRKLEQAGRIRGTRHYDGGIKWAKLEDESWWPPRSSNSWPRATPTRWRHLSNGRRRSSRSWAPYWVTSTRASSTWASAVIRRPSSRPSAARVGAARSRERSSGASETDPEWPLRPT